MDVVSQLLRPSTLAILIPIVSIVSVFTVIGLKAHYKHKERLAKIQAGIDPDAPVMMHDEMMDKI